MAESCTFEPIVLDSTALDGLIASLAAGGYEPVGPRVRDGAVMLGPIGRAADLPVGWTERQEAGTYRLERRGDAAVFGFSVGPASWKGFLWPARVTMVTSRRDGDEVVYTAPPEPARRYAFIGVRACDLAAMDVLDRVLDGGRHPDPGYGARRREAFVVAVQCAQAGGTCFCVSMGTGPRAVRGFDLALTELIDPGGHRFLVEVGSARGAEVVAALPHRAAAEADLAASRRQTEACARQMGRTMEAAGLKELLYANLEHPRWDDVATRCLACSNCTMVCPTCFCTDVQEATDLVSGRQERARVWDSCFNASFSGLHGVPVRASIRSRYRQWLTHKVATWHDQFGTSGCIGCGRCITWCPVGIDLTAEVAAIRGTDVRRTGEESRGVSEFDPL